MLISIEELKSTYSDFDFSKFNDERLKRKLLAIEQAIRQHTHNSFTNRNFKTECYCQNGNIYGHFAHFEVGDTVEIYDSKINDGLYEIIDKLDDNTIIVEGNMYDCESMKAIKVEYPLDVIEGCIELLDYDCNYRSNLKAKKGIASESISRHSVSYVQYNQSNSLKGYPIELLSFLEPYIRWRT